MQKDAQSQGARSIEAMLTPICTVLIFMVIIVPAKSGVWTGLVLIGLQHCSQKQISTLLHLVWQKIAVFIWLPRPEAFT